MANKHAVAFLLLMLGTSACSTVGPVPLDGMWTASSDGLGGELTLVIRTQGAAVTGEARQSRGALESAPLSLSGSYRAPTLALKLKSPEGLVWSVSAKFTGSEIMNATLTWPTGTVQTLKFVRP